MKRYIPLILMEGATVMAVELCGAKMLAPLYGGSLFVWAAILAVTLAALAFGYYYGGVLSSKNEPQKKLFTIVLLAGICVLLMPFISSYVIPPVSYLEFKIAVVLSATLVIFLPIFFLGCTTPLLVRLNTDKAESAGLVSGKIYAISTVGGIFSTLLCGFFLIPGIGMKMTLMIFAILLFVCSVLVLKVFNKSSIIPFGIAILLAARSVTAQHDPSILYFKYGVMGDISVRDENSLRKLFINRTVQAEMDLNTKLSPSNYIHVIDSLVPKPEKKRESALILGLGGGLLAHLFQKKDYAVTAVEFDPRVIEVAKNFFDLDPGVECYEKDARTFINESSAIYDYVVLDLFKGEEQPFHVLTRESFQKVSSCLNEKGTMIINWHGYLEGDLGEGTQILLNTLRSANFSTDVIPGPGLPDNRNLVIVCKKGSDPCDLEQVLNTDDQPVIELANAKANLRWRWNYLKYYQSAK
jgi:predicted membrane-bound spermidine synthase